MQHDTEPALPWWSARSLLDLLLFLVITFAAAGAGALATQTGPDSWYEGLQKPSFAPPPEVFPYVWNTLYALMALAAWLVWRTGNTVYVPMRFYVVHLLVNGVWSFLFFRLQRPDFAFYDLLLLWVLIVCLVRLFWVHRRVASLLLVPYLGWVTFAGAVNLAIVLQNPPT